MKQIKFNLLAIIGMMVAVGTVAFTNKALVEEVWYEVELNINTNEHELTEITSAPAPSDDCLIEYSGQLCKVKVSADTPPPSSVESASPGQILSEAKRTF